MLRSLRLFLLAVVAMLAMQAPPCLGAPPTQPGGKAMPMDCGHRGGTHAACATGLCCALPATEARTAMSEPMKWQPLPPEPSRFAPPGSRAPSLDPPPPRLG